MNSASGPVDIDGQSVKDFTDILDANLVICRAEMLSSYLHKELFLLSCFR